MGRVRIGFTRDDRLVVLELWRCRCAYCGRGLSQMESSALDHIVPWSAGGEHCLANLAAACASCNGQKGSAPNWDVFDAQSKARAIAVAVLAAVERGDELVLGVETAIVRMSSIVRKGWILSGPAMERQS